MRKFKTITLLFLLLFTFLSGCNSPLDKKVKEEADEQPEQRIDKDKQSEQKINKKDTKLTKVSTESINQSIANEAKHKILSMEEILEVKAVNFDNELYLAVKPEHHERFQLRKLKQKIKQTLKRVYPNFKIYVSTDKKILMLLDELETKIKNKTADKQKIQKELKTIKTEMNSDT